MIMYIKIKRNDDAYEALPTRVELTNRMNGVRNRVHLCELTNARSPRGSSFYDSPPGSSFYDSPPGSSRINSLQCAAEYTYAWYCLRGRKDEKHYGGVRDSKGFPYIYPN